MSFGAVDPVVATATLVAIGVVALVARLMRRAARTHRMRIAIVWGAVVLGAGVAVGGYLVNRVLVVTTSSYAVWETADLVILHMERNEMAWPRSWDELQSFARRLPPDKKSVSAQRADGTVEDVWNAPGPDRIEYLRTLVDLDWTASPARLARVEPPGSGPPFRVIFLRDGSSDHFVGREPNQRVLDYLRWKTRHSPGAKPGR